MGMATAVREVLAMHRTVPCPACNGRSHCLLTPPRQSSIPLVRCTSRGGAQCSCACSKATEHKQGHAASAMDRQSFKQQRLHQASVSLEQGAIKLLAGNMR